MEERAKKKELWWQTPNLAIVQQMSQGSLVQHLGIELVGWDERSLSGRMPVDERTRQPAGVLHGGASVAFAETLGTWAAVLTVDPSQTYCVGMEVNANHLRPVKTGWVWGKAEPIHIGRRSQVWGIEIRDEEGRMVCISRLTVACLEMPSQYGKVNADA